ncbi:Protein TTLL-11 b, partial [Aphelenchoides avenae]
MCARKLNIEEYPEGRSDDRPCSIYWHNVVYGDIKQVVKGAPDSRVNKFPGMTDLSKKIALTQAIRSMKELFPEEYRFYPNSWVIPAQLAEFEQHCRRNANGGWYIVKPDDGSQGTGIRLINSPAQLHTTSEKQLIQEYIDSPFLLTDQLKFDFRVYAVIKSINPLSIYIAREGMARFCTERYAKPTSSNFENLYSHLTNYSLNKANASYVHSTNLRDQLRGSKRLLSTVFHQMEAHGIRTRRLWHDIKMIVVKTVLAMVPEIMLNYEHCFGESAGPQCFQIMGFDIIVRKDGVPILLEVNSAPSLTIDHNLPVLSEDGTPSVRSIVDEMIKVPLVRDCMLLVLNQMDQQYSAREEYGGGADTMSWDSRTINSVQSEDDLGVIRRKRRPHLSEVRSMLHLIRASSDVLQIFPARYGHTSKHLLILDRAVYLFMQFVHVKHSLTLSLQAAKAFLKKCNLLNDVSFEELEEKYAAINYYFTAKEGNTNTGLPFHGFLQLLFFVARRKFDFREDLLGALQRLMAYCDTSLRHYGVRSTRLRRAEIENDERA